MDARDLVAYNTIVNMTDWKDPPQLTSKQVSDYAHQIKQIGNEDTRRRAYRALKDRDPDAVERLLNEKD